MSFKALLLIAMFALPVSAWAENTTKIWAGSVGIWKRPVCLIGEVCDAPTPLVQPIPTKIEFQAPIQPGAFQVADQIFEAKNWRVQLTLFWVNPPAGSSTPAYVVTQLRLSEKVLGVLAECSRYDGVEELKFLPPGSCGGRDGNMMYGVSVIGQP